MHDIQLAGWHVAQAGDISVFGLSHHRCTVTCTVCLLASLVSIRSSNRMRVVAKTFAYRCSELALQSTNNSSGTGTNKEAPKRDKEATRLTIFEEVGNQNLRYQEKTDMSRSINGKHGMERDEIKKTENPYIISRED